MNATIVIRSTVAVTVFITASFVGVVVAQTGPCTEQAIRAANASGAGNSLADDVYVASPANKEPIVGRAEVERVGKIIHSMRKNEHYGPNPPDHIVAAPSGDMAYAYGTRRITFDDMQIGKHVEFTNAYLQVWKAVGGTCKIAATMSER